MYCVNTSVILLPDCVECVIKRRWFSFRHCTLYNGIRLAMANCARGVLILAIFASFIEQGSVTASCPQLNERSHVEFNVTVCGNWPAEVYKTDAAGSQIEHIATCVNSTFCNVTDPRWRHFTGSPRYNFRVDINCTDQAGYYRLDSSCDGRTSEANTTLCITGSPTKPVISRRTSNTDGISLVCDSNSTTEPPTSRRGLTYKWRVGNWSNENCTVSTNDSHNALNIVEICWGANVTVTCTVIDDSLSVEGSVTVVAKQEKSLTGKKPDGLMAVAALLVTFSVVCGVIDIWLLCSRQPPTANRPSSRACGRPESDGSSPHVDLADAYADVLDATTSRQVTAQNVQGPINHRSRRNRSGANDRHANIHSSVQTTTARNTDHDPVHLCHSNGADTQNLTLSTGNESTKKE